MAGPELAFGMAGMAIAGGIAGAAGQLMAGDAAARGAEIEARGQERAAGLSLAAGFERGRLIRRQGRRVAGSQVAGYAASGVDPGSGSALLVRLESARQTELEALKQEFAGLESATTLRTQAALTRFGGRTAKRNATLGAVGSILSSGAKGLLFASGGLKAKPTTAPGSQVLATDYGDIG